MTPQNSSSFISSLFNRAIQESCFSHAYIFYNFETVNLTNIAHTLIDHYASHHQHHYGVSPEQKAQCPDIITLEYDKSIKIETIKHLQDRIAYSPHQHPYCFVLIEHCDLLTPGAANAFLKTLEEPNPNIIFLLSSQRINSVLSTIKSRCQLIYTPGSESPQPENQVTMPYSEFQSLPLHQQLSFCQELATDKASAKTLCLQWLSDIFTHSPSSFSRQSLLLDTLKKLEYNVNLRLQLEALCLQLHRQPS
ncbi:hypothetical protein DID78_04640 [Candidatus Marinamargulisbacteria bacterium SCGC AG-343-D04]|nr:hypothetical protein DID78_04640 [Candidatus Marinamargulisbacteria bacterium SCGC AG-343-D04]